MSRGQRLGMLAVAALGAVVFGLLVVGNIGEVRPELNRIAVSEILAGGAPAERYGNAEIRIVGWYAELSRDCRGDSGGVDASVAWLQRDCPLRALLPEQPSEQVTQAELEHGLRLAAPLGRPFPSRAQPGGPNLRLEQLVFVGHFNDAAAARCVPERAERCRNTFVVVDYAGLIR
ncbi:MAG: hypothetical protein M3R05_01955 [Chloroflexota bacterium]|nr:hypothetical protein [Chloroflexota bacterium]